MGSGLGAMVYGSLLPLSKLGLDLGVSQAGCIHGEGLASVCWVSWAVGLRASWDGAGGSPAALGARSAQHTSG